MLEVPITSHLKARHYLLSIIRKAGRKVERIPPERQLAEKLSISRGTVRKAIQQLVDEGLLVAKQGIGTYVDPSSSYSMSQRSTGITRLGLLIGDGMAAYYSPSNGRMLGAFIEAFGAAKADFTMISFNSKDDYTYESLTVSAPGGVVWIKPPLAAVGLLQELVARSYPVVIVDSPLAIEGISNVATDFIEVGRMAARYLVSMGHRRIILGGLTETNGCAIEEECRKGFIEVMNLAGLEHGDDLAINSIGEELEGDFTAGFVAHEFFLRSFSDYATRHPEGGGPDIVVFSNAVNVAPGLNIHTIMTPVDKLAKRAVSLLTGKLENSGQKAEHILLRPEIIPCSTD